VCERLTWHGYIDASDMTVKVQDGEVILEGVVEDRWTKRAAEGVAESVAGVRDIHNWLTLRGRSATVR
jgi:osmotically-inducible protein OsmY